MSGLHTKAQFTEFYGAAGATKMWAKAGKQSKSAPAPRSRGDAPSCWAESVMVSRGTQVQFRGGKLTRPRWGLQICRASRYEIPIA